MNSLKRAALSLTVAALALGGPAGTLEEATRELYRAGYPRAAALAEQYVKANPKAAAGRVLLARVRIAQGQNDAAWRELQRALRLDPANVDALYFLGRLCALLSHAEFQKLYAMAPDSARVHQLLAEAADAQGDQAQAEQEYRAALNANPRSGEILIALGELKRMQSQYDEAADYYRRASEVNPWEYDSAYGLGVCHLRMDQPEKAVPAFRRAVSLDPASAVAHFALGDALFQLGQAEEAMKELEAAATLEPAMRQAYNLLGRVYQELGRKEEAAAAFRKFRELHRQEIEQIQEQFEKQRKAAGGRTSLSGESRP